MRIPTYLSYSSFSLYEKQPEEFYLKHLTPNRPAKLPQEQPASVGSGFDARVKSDYHARLFGANSNPKYTFEALFEAQVEPHNRDWALEESKYIFECYKTAGPYDTLFALLEQSIEPPRFEFEVKTTLFGVPILTKPDCGFVLPGPIDVVHDWKVNGYCSNSTTSPNKGYLICNDGFRGDKQNKSHAQSHKQFKPLSMPYRDRDGAGRVFTIDEGCLEDCSPNWADQLSLYGWSLGKKVGEPTILSVDQLVFKPMPEGRPQCRVASYRARVRKSYQEHLAKRLQSCWEVINSGWIFRDMTREESDLRIDLLDKQSVASQGGTPTDDFFNEVVRAKYRG